MSNYQNLEARNRRWLQMYLDGVNIVEIARQEGVTKQRVAQVLQRYGEYRDCNARSRAVLPKSILEELREEGLTMREIAKKTGFKLTKVFAMLKAYNIENVQTQTQAQKRKAWRKAMIQKLRADGLKGTEIARQLKVVNNTVYRLEKEMEDEGRATALP